MVLAPVAWSFDSRAPNGGQDWRHDAYPGCRTRGNLKPAWEVAGNPGRLNRPLLPAGNRSWPPIRLRPRGRVARPGPPGPGLCLNVKARSPHPPLRQFAPPNAHKRAHGARFKSLMVLAVASDLPRARLPAPPATPQCAGGSCTGRGPPVRSRGLTTSSVPVGLCTELYPSPNLLGRCRGGAGGRVRKSSTAARF